MHHAQPVLYASLRSPFARRIRLALHRLGIPYQEKMLDVFQENPDLNSANPLGLVPTLTTESGSFSDSQNLLEYLHETTGGIWSPDPAKRLLDRQISIWVAGIMQSTVLYFQEQKLHEVPSPRWLKEHGESIHQTLNHLSGLPESVWFREPNRLSQTGWDLCVALEYLELRIPELNWKSLHPSFLRLLEKARENENFRNTTPPA